MKALTIICATVAVAMSFGTSTGQAQVVIHGPYGGGVTLGGPIVSPGWGHVQPLGPAYPAPHWAQPTHPEFVTAPQFDGYTPWGGVNTRNTQVDNTYFAPNRQASQLNGSQRYVDRPVYDSWGRVVGRERGMVWNNSWTGAEHGNLQTETPNGAGGTNTTMTLRSTAGGNIRPMNADGN